MATTFFTKRFVLRMSIFEDYDSNYIQGKSIKNVAPSSDVSFAQDDLSPDILTFTINKKNKSAKKMDTNMVCEVISLISDPNNATINNVWVSLKVLGLEATRNWFISKLYGLLSKHSNINLCHIEHLTDFLISSGTFTNIHSKNIEVSTRMFVEKILQSIEDSALLTQGSKTGVAKSTNAGIITRTMTGDVSMSEGKGKEGPCVGRVGSLVAKYEDE